MLSDLEYVLQRTVEKIPHHHIEANKECDGSEETTPADGEEAIEPFEQDNCFLNYAHGNVSDLKGEKGLILASEQNCCRSSKDQPRIELHGPGKGAWALMRSYFLNRALTSL